MTKALLVMLSILLLAVLPAYAQEQVTYVSQPEAVTVFLNNVAFVRDSLLLTGDSEAQISLPDQIFADTLIVSENGERVVSYRLNRSTGPLILSLPPSETPDVREITLEYLVSGISWKPNYDMAFTQGAETVDFNCFAEIQNTTYSLEEVDVTLVAGRVDTTQQVGAIDTITMNQYYAGYDEIPATGSQVGTGAVTIQHTYALGLLDIAPNDTFYLQLLEKDLPARRLLLWNSQSDLQVSVIYKLRNDSEIALTEGVVRSYEDGLFVGSDFIEFTPVGSEGSVTVGNLQDVRVNRAESVTYQDLTFSDADSIHEITFEMSNFSTDDVTIEVVDSWPTGAIEFEFSQEPEREAGNLFRWIVTIPAGETVTIDYTFRGLY